MYNRIHYLQNCKNKINFIKNKKIYNELSSQNKQKYSIIHNYLNTYKRKYHTHKLDMPLNNDNKNDCDGDGDGNGNDNGNDNDIIKIIMVVSSIGYLNSNKK